jgi:hypothetical protein
MKKAIYCLAVLALLASPASADNLFFETGPGLFKSLGSQVFVLRYKKDTSTVFGWPSYYEALISHWTGENRDNALAVSRAISFPIGFEQYFSPTFGIAGIPKETSHLGTNFQFYFRFAYDFRIKGRDLSLAVIHYSNGKMIFGWDGPNSGENFFTLSVALF